MEKYLNLTEIGENALYQVAGFDQQNTEYAEKLHKMGFIKGRSFKSDIWQYARYYGTQKKEAIFPRRERKRHLPCGRKNHCV